VIVPIQHHMERPIVTAVGRLLTPKHGEPQVIDRITIRRRMVPEIVSVTRTRITVPPAP
jgi:hypothetical protein